jgi:hypothetical protein
MGQWTPPEVMKRLLFSNYSPGSALPFVISTGANPDFLLRAADRTVCAAVLKKTAWC